MNDLFVSHMNRKHLSPTYYCTTYNITYNIIQCAIHGAISFLIIMCVYLFRCGDFILLESRITWPPVGNESCLHYVVSNDRKQLIHLR